MQDHTEHRTAQLEQQLRDEDDEMMRLALEASVNDQRERKTGPLYLSGGFGVSRSTVLRDDRHAPASPQEGCLLQLNVIDQFHGFWDEIIKDYRTPTFCIIGFNKA